MAAAHPASSKYDLYEAFRRKIVDEAQSQPQLWASTAILTTNDEGGGDYNPGYIQPVDFLGDGPRIPLIVGSPYLRGGRVVRESDDHASIVKFIVESAGATPVAVFSLEAHGLRPPAE